MPSRPHTDDRTRRFVLWTVRNGGWLWLATLLLAVPAAWRMVGLYANLRSDIEELLPPDAPSVKALDEMRGRMPGLQFLGVLVDAGANANPARMKAAERFVDDLAARVRRYPPAMVGGVRLGFSAERAFIESHAPMLIDLVDLTIIRERIEDRLHYEYGKTTGTLLDDTGPPALDFADIQQRYQARAPTRDLAGDRFSSSRLGLSLLLIEAGGFSTNARQAKHLIELVQADTRALGGPGAYAPGLVLGFTGDVAIAAEETAALMQDLTISSILVVLAVIAALMLYFRWWGAIVVLLVPLGVATVFAFALGSLLGIRELNSNTAFLGSIIVGNGINFGIIQLARYVEARRQACQVEEALSLALWGTRTGTLSAALAAGVSYASLIIMQFRGFRQFGVIGGLGMVLSWGATFVLGPPLIAWLDRGRTRALQPRFFSLYRPNRPYRPMALLSRWVSRHPRGIVAIALALTTLAVIEVRHFGSDQLEYDFSRMRRADTWRSGEGYWGSKMNILLGQYLTPTVLLSDTVDESRAMAAGLRRVMQVSPLAQMVATVRTVDDVLPVDQEARRAEIERIRKKLTPNIRAALEPQQAVKLDELLGSFPARPIFAAEVPPTLLKGLLEHDGQAGRAVLVYPKPSAGLWEGPRNAAFVSALRAVARVPESMGGRTGRVAGGPPLTADIIASMNRDGPLASMLAFGGVVMTVLLLFRFGVATPFVLGSLMIGVVWLAAAAMISNIKINFINFIAFPITFGIGVDYAVNFMARYLKDGTGDVAGAIRGTGGAVGLCSVTTILGYSSLLFAQNRGLFSFGLLAVLGEITCLVAAIVVLPAALLVLRRGRRPEIPGAPSANADAVDTEPSGLRTIPGIFDRQ
jgi:predicted RND superfamily exporter protein